MPDRRVSIDFYRVNVRDDAPAFEFLLSTADGLSIEDRTIAVRDAPIRLQEVATTGPRYEGDLVRIRMDEVPDRASLRGPIAPFDLEDDEGMGEHTAFLYFTPYRLLVIQRNRYAVSASAFVEYLERLNSLMGAVTLDPIIEPGTLARFNEISDFRQFEVSVAGIHNPQTILDVNPGAGVQKMTEMITEFEAPSAYIYLSMGHEQGSLDRGIVRRSIDRLMRVSRDTPVNVRKLVVSGYTADDERYVLDLLRDRMVETASITVVRRQLPYSGRRRALREALETRRGQLDALFGVAT